MISTILTLIAIFGISAISSSMLMNWGLPREARDTLEKLKAGYYVFNYVYGGHYHFVLPMNKDYITTDDPVIVMFEKDRIHFRLPNGKFLHHGWTTFLDAFTSNAQKELIEWFYANKEKFDSQDHQEFVDRAKIKLYK